MRKPKRARHLYEKASLPVAIARTDYMIDLMQRLPEDRINLDICVGAPGKTAAKANILECNSPGCVTGHILMEFSPTKLVYVDFGGVVRDKSTDAPLSLRKTVSNWIGGDNVTHADLFCFAKRGSTLTQREQALDRLRRHRARLESAKCTTA